MNTRQRVQAAIPGFSGRIAAHYVGYNADGHVHRNLPYADANSPSVIMKQLELMQSDGIDIVFHTWQGAFAEACNDNAWIVAATCARFGMEFALLLDPWAAKLSATGQNTNYTANVAASLKAVDVLFDFPSYCPEKFVLDFNTGADLGVLANQFPAYKFLPQQAGFSWINIPPASITESKARNAWSVANLKGQHQNPAMQIASFCESFDDSGMPLPAGVVTQAAFDASGGVRDLTQSVWGGPARILESFGGEFALQQLATIPATVPIVACLTWNDYDERSSGPREQVVAEENGVDFSKV